MGLRNACHFPPCSLIPFKGTSHAPFSKSTPLAQQSGQMNTGHQSLGQTAEVRMHTVYAGPVSFPEFVVRPLSVSTGCLDCHDMIKPVGSKESSLKSKWESTWEWETEKKRDAKMKNKQSWEGSKRSCFGYWWPHVVFSLPGDWGVLFCILALFPCVIQ